MRKALLLSLLTCSLITLRAQEPVYDSLAIQLLDRMADILSDLHSCAIHIDVSQTKPDTDYGQLTHFSSHDVKYSGKLKFLLRNSGEQDDSGYWFNGEDIYYYSYRRNYYGHLEVSGLSTLEVIDGLHQKYGIDFPAIDFFYPGFTDDLIAQTTRIEFFGLTQIGTQPCYKIAATGTDLTVEIWLTQDVVTLPIHMVVVNKKTNSTRYEAHYSKWDLNPDIPDAVFNFSVPPDATSLTIVPASK
jgi:hypothetical protein